MQVGLGIGLEHDDRSNVVVREIIPGYGAFAAGTIEPGDILLAVDGRSEGLGFRVMIVLLTLLLAGDKENGSVSYTHLTLPTKA